MKSIQRRLAAVEKLQQVNEELCLAYFYVRKGHEVTDEEVQIEELRKFHKYLPGETYYKIYPFESHEETYENFTQRVRRNCPFEEWWTIMSQKYVPVRDCADVVKDFKKLK